MLKPQKEKHLGFEEEDDDDDNDDDGAKIFLELLYFEKFAGRGSEGRTRKKKINSNEKGERKSR